MAPKKGQATDSTSTSLDTDPSNETSTRLSREGNAPPDPKEKQSAKVEPPGQAEKPRGLSLPQLEVFAPLLVGLTYDATLEGQDGDQPKPLEKPYADLQKSLLRSLHAVYTSNEAVAKRCLDKKGLAEVTEEIRVRDAALKAEQLQGVFGPASKQAFKEYLHWMQAGRVPETISLLETVRPENYRELVRDCEKVRDLKIDPDKVPDEADMRSLSTLYGVLSQSVLTYENAQNEFTNRGLSKLFSSNPAYAGWQRQAGEDPEAWRLTATDMYDLSARSRNYVQAMVSFYQASVNDNFPLTLPPGATITVSYNGQRRTISDKDLTDPGMRSFIKEGKLEEVSLADALPKTLNQADPENVEKIKALRNWLAIDGKAMDQVYAQTKNNPEPLMFGDIEVMNGKGRFDKNERFLGLVDPEKYTPVDGESLRDLNLVGCDFNVTAIQSGKDAGKFRITQTVRAEKAPWWAYLNARCLGIEKVGEDMVLAEQIVGPDDFVKVSTGGGKEPQLVKVGDRAQELLAFKHDQELGYYGPKIFDAGLNVAMTVTGTIEIAAAFKALQSARLAAVGLALTEKQIAAGLALTGREAAWELGKGGLRLGAALAGIGDNAGARESQLGRSIQYARQGVFLLDVMGGTSRGLGGLLRNGEQNASALSAAEKVQMIISGRKAKAGVEALEGWAGVKDVHELGSSVFGAAELYFGASLPPEIARRLGVIDDPRKQPRTDRIADGVAMRGTGRDSQIGRTESFEPAQLDNLGSDSTVLDSFSRALQEGRSEKVAQQVKEIFDMTKRLLETQTDEKGKAANEQAKREYKDRLLRSISFTPEQIVQLELAHPESQKYPGYKFTEERLKDLMNPDRSSRFPESVRARAAAILESKDKDVVAATHLALLSLSKGNDGHVAGDLGKLEFTVPGYIARSFGTERGPVVVEFSSRRDSFTYSSRESVDYLERQLASSNSNNREIVVGDALTRLGVSSPHQYAMVLENILKDPASKPEDRMRALTSANGGRIASLFESIRKQEESPTSSDSPEQRERGLVQSFGVSSESILSSLESAAKTDSDLNVRAMAAGLAYALREPDAGKRATLVKEYSSKWTFGNPERFSEEVRQSLFLASTRRARSDDSSEGAQQAAQQRKFNAAQSLALISDPNKANEQLQLTETMAKALKGASRQTMGQIIDTLIPERIAMLDKANPKAAEQIREYCLDALTSPCKPGEEGNIVKLISQIEPLLKGTANPEFKEKFVENLETLLKNSGDSPQLRVAAIEKLTQLGSRSSLPLIEKHLASTPFRAKDGFVLALESNPLVRAAAVKAVGAMQPEDISEGINRLISAETDSRVILALRDVRTSQHQSDYSRPRKDGQTDSKGVGVFDASIDYGRYPYLKDFDFQKRMEWLDENFDLLDPKKFAKACDKAAVDATNFGYRMTSWFGETQTAERNSVSQVEKRRMEQFHELSLCAQGVNVSDEQANRAKLVMLELLRYPTILGAEGHTIRVRGNSLDTKVYNPDWPSFIAKSFKEMAEPGVRNRDLTGYCIKTGMTEAPGVPGHASMELRDALKLLGQPSVDGRISQEEINQTTHRALFSELHRQERQQSDYYQIQLMKDLDEYNYRPSLVLIDTIASSSSFAAARKEAMEISNGFRDVVRRSWRDTVVDATATPLERAARVRESIRREESSEIVVKKIFDAYKGYKWQDQDDPAVEPLQTALRSRDEQIQLAAITVILQSQSPASTAMHGAAVERLKSLSIKGSYEHRKVAREMLAASRRL